MPEVIFPIRVTADDWDSHTRAWRCPALDIPSAVITEAYDPSGVPVSLSLLEAAKGPARVSWRGADPPPGLLLEVGLEEELSPAKDERWWRKIAIVAPPIAAVLAALIGAAAASYKPIPVPDPGPKPIPVSPPVYTLTFRVDPNDIESSGLPRAKIIVNNVEQNQPIIYAVKSDVNALVDVSRAIDAAKGYISGYNTQREAIDRATPTFNDLFSQLNALNAHVNGDICGGGSNGVPSPVRGGLSAQTTAISDKLRALSGDLQAVLLNKVAP